MEYQVLAVTPKNMVGRRAIFIDHIWDITNGHHIVLLQALAHLLDLRVVGAKGLLNMMGLGIVA